MHDCQKSNESAMTREQNRIQAFGTKSAHAKYRLTLPLRCKMFRMKKKLEASSIHEHSSGLSNRQKRYYKNPRCERKSFLHEWKIHEKVNIC